MHHVTLLKPCNLRSMKELFNCSYGFVCGWWFPHEFSTRRRPCTHSLPERRDICLVILPKLHLFALLRCHQQNICNCCLL